MSRTQQKGRAQTSETEPRSPRFNEYTLLRVGTALSIGSAILAGGAALYFSSGPLFDKRMRIDGDRYLVRTLEELKGAWEPQRREEILAGAPQKRDQWAGQLHRILRQPQHPLLEEAVDYTAAMGSLEHRQALVELTQHRQAVQTKTTPLCARTTTMKKQLRLELLRRSEARAAALAVRALGLNW